MEVEKLGLGVRNGEAAAFVGCSKRSLAAAVRSGELPSAMIGSQRLVSKDALRAWFERRMKGVPPARKKALRSLAQGAAKSRAKVHSNGR